MAIERSSDKHGRALDEQMKKEVEGMLHAGRPTRSEAWHDPEPIEDEDAPTEEELIEQRRAAEAGRSPGQPAAGSSEGAGTDREG
jgi:hypothetical protein